VPSSRIAAHGAAALQDWREDLLPLFLLFSVSATGILLWVSYTWMHGYGYSFLSLLHAITVIFTLLWMPIRQVLPHLSTPCATRREVL